MNGSPWCAMFVSYCAYQAGISEDLVPRFSWCESGATWYRIRKRYHKRYEDYIPKIGDVIFYFNYDMGRIAHTGVVIGGDENTVLVAEGNTTHDRVEIITRNISSRDIDGYGDNYGTPIFERKLSYPDLARAVQHDIHDIIGYTFGADAKYDEEFTVAVMGNVRLIAGYTVGGTILSGNVVTSFNVVNGTPDLSFDLSERIFLGFAGVESADLGMDVLLKLFSYSNDQYGVDTNCTVSIKMMSRIIDSEEWIWI